jgi:PNKP adenylyltransferase domain, ligase domain
MDLKKLETRIDYFAAQKVNHFSPTISPAPKNVADNEVESIAEALKYYAEKGITEVVIQPKYMGSYCDIYLHRELAKTYFVSRNGHVIKHLDMDLAQQKCVDLHQKLSPFWKDGAAMILVQSELMPWSALGKGLVDREFRGYEHSHRLHKDFLQQSSIYEKIANVKQSEAFLTFEKDYKTLKDKELKDKYKMHIIRQYESILALKMLDLTEYESDIELYKSQVDCYGKESELFFKPFNILKIVYENGRETILNDHYKGFLAVSEDTQLLVNLQDMEKARTDAYAFFNTLVNENYEGVMVKPVVCFTKNIPPAFKVRNNQYLQMIYGVDFRKDYAYYLDRRNIRKKLDCSINDWAISYEMLKIPHSTLDSENYLLKLLCYKRIMQEEIENGLDTRL